VKKIRVGGGQPGRPGPARAAGEVAVGGGAEGGAAGGPGGPVRGFAAAFRDVVARKFRELTGRRWQVASEAQKRAEAARRGAREMARRIERQTGRRPAESTVRRNASRDATPRGADQQRLDRQAGIDRAGGVKQFAARAGISARQAARWRDVGAPIHPAATAIDVEFDVTGDIFHVGEHNITPDYDRRLADHVEMEEPVASDFIEAYASGDVDRQMDILGDQITVKVVSMWPGREGRTSP
jgi:hypothetical protein